MAAHRFFRHCAGLLAVVSLVTVLMASEHEGTVTANGLPVPGATVTATQGDKKFATTTDDRGVYQFANLPDGTWTIHVEMLGFAPLTREVGIAPDAPSPVWSLTLLTLDAVKRQIAPAAAAAAPAHTAPSQTVANQTAGPVHGGSVRPQSASNAASPGGRNGSAGGRGNGGPNGGRPSLRQAMGQGGFQRLDVNETGDGFGQGVENGSDNLASLAGTDPTQSSDAYVLNGSVSNGLELPQQNDWQFGGRGGMGPGGPGGMEGLGGPGAMDGPPQGGAAGGPGGERGAMMGGGGFGGGRGGGGGFGGGGFGGRGFGGGRGNRQNGRGGRGYQASFGNGRRDRRMQYNGNLNFTYGNTALDARPYSLTGQDTAKAAGYQARTSIMFGGPLKIPHLLDGTKTSFNINYQFARNRNGSTFSGLMPTAAERAGDFSQAVNAQTGVVAPIFDPSTGQPFPNNVIPQSRISAQSQSLMAYYPLPNYLATARYNYQIPLVGIGDTDNLNTRINHTINSRNQLNGGFHYQRATNTSPNGFGFVDHSNSTGVGANVGYIYHFTPHVIDTLRYNFSRSSMLATPFFANSVNVSGAAGILGNNQDPLNWGPPQLSFSSGFSSLSDSQESSTHNQTSAVGNTLIWIRGSHNVIFGGDFRRQQFNLLTQQNGRGTFQFTGGLTSQYVNGVATIGTGFDFADFLLGFPDTYKLATGNADKYLRTSWYDAYVVDDWHINSKVTLNAGLRWDYSAPETELYGRLVNLDVGGFYSNVTPVCGAAIGTCPSGTGPLSGQSYGASLIRPDKHNFAPRLGIAWRPFTKHSTVVRAGYGIYYNTSVYSSLASQMEQQSPLSRSLNLANTPADPVTLSNAFLASPNTVTNTFAVDPNFLVGYAQTWQVSVQQSLPAAFVLTGTYIGTKGSRNPQLFLPNSTAPGYLGTALGEAGYAYAASNGDSTYEAGQIQLMRRFRSGLSGRVMYVYSHSIDDAAGLGGRVQTLSGYAQNWLDLDAERADSTFDQRHRMTAYMQYSTGQGTRGGALVNGWKGALIKDWTFTTNITVGSGLPETPIVVNNRSVAGGTGFTGTLRADFTGQPVADAPTGLAYNPQAFLAPAAGTWGNAGRDSLRGPSQFSLNGSAGRVFRLGDRRSLDLRFDANNLLNHVVYQSWNSTVGNLQFGLPATVNSMRSLTANLRFRF
jgi:hypothetical protein